MDLIISLKLVVLFILFFSVINARKKKKNKNKTLFCDIDETLIRDLKDDENADIKFNFNGQTYEKKINYKLIEHLKSQSDKDYYIILWTSNSLGYEWAEVIKKKLKLNFVNECLFKPVEIIDDMPLNEISHINYKLIKF